MKRSLIESVLSAPKRVRPDASDDEIAALEQQQLQAALELSRLEGAGGSAPTSSTAAAAAGPRPRVDLVLDEEEDDHDVVQVYGPARPVQRQQPASSLLATQAIEVPDDGPQDTSFRRHPRPYAAPPAPRSRAPVASSRAPTGRGFGHDDDFEVIDVSDESTSDSDSMQEEDGPSTLEVDRMIRAEQDEAYLESLRADREKERKARHEARVRRREERLRREAAEDELAIKMSLEVSREDRCARLAASLPPEPPANDPLATVIAVRLPAGGKLERRFLRTDKVQALKDFIESKAIELKLPEQFDIVSDFPKKVYNSLDATLEEVGLVPRALVSLHMP